MAFDSRVFALNAMPLTRVIATLILLLLLPPLAEGATLELIKTSKEQFPLGRYLDLLEDKAGTLTLEEVVSPQTAQNFQPSDKAIPNFGFTPSVYWARVEVLNRHPVQEKWLLELSYPLLDLVEVWVPDEAGRYQKRTTGDLFPFSEREVKYHNFLFHLDLAPGQTKQLYLRFKTQSSMQMPLTLWSSQRFTEVISREMYGIGIYYGIMLSMILYNLFIYLSVRDQSYLNYVFYILAYILFQMSLNGLAYQYLWPRAVWWGNVAVPALLCLTLGFALRFAQTYLSLATHLPKSNRYFWGLEAVLAGVVLASFVGTYALAIRLGAGLAVVVVTSIAVTGVRIWRKGYRPAAYYLLAWSSILAGAAAYALKSFGVVPSMFITDNGMQIGSAMEVILLSLGLADRINVMRKEKYLAEREAHRASQEALEQMQIAAAHKEENLRIISENNRTLEAKVAERTAAIQDLMDNTGQGFLSFGPDFKINMEHSKACETFFGADLTGRNALDLLFLQSETHPPEQVKELAEMLFSGTDMALVDVLLPERIEVNGRTLGCQFKVIDAGGTSRKIMIILTDITKEVALAAQVKADEERQAVVVKVAMDRTGFLQFLRELEGLLAGIHRSLDLSGQQFDLRQLLRNFHTIKGGSASYALHKVARKAHEIESRLEPASKGREALGTELLAEIKTETQDLERLLQEALTMLGDIIPPEERNQHETVYRVADSKILKLESFMLERIGAQHLALIKKEIEHLCAQPVASLLRKYANAAEELGNRLNKQVQVEIKGLEVEVPMKKLDNFFAALIHLVRNSVDHGLEDSATRTMLGKPAFGKLLIEASRHNGEFVIKVEDDGAGIDQERVTRIAVEKGLITANEALHLPLGRAIGFIFEPGFSTKDQVSDVSGRGVGMDAVKAEVEALRGRILVETWPDQGTRFQLHIPLVS